MLKFTERPKTQGINFKKAWLSLKGISYLQVIFVHIWMKQTLMWFNLHSDRTGNGLSGLSRLSDGWVKYKEKVPDLSDPNQNVKTTCSSKLKVTFIHQKVEEKLVKDELCM